MNFSNWLFIENTVSQQLQKLPPDQLKQKMAFIEKTLLQIDWIRNIPKDKLTPLFKWAVFRLTSVNHMEVMQVIAHNQAFLTYMFNNQFNELKSKLNDANYTDVNLSRDSQIWHQRLSQKKVKEADPGRPLDIAGMPPGWQWVSLDTNYCEKEGKAMGHCGNEGGTGNIYSLRDSRGKPHLTFIVDHGSLGESKGFGNQKPQPQYHPQIVALLLGKDRGEDIINYITGGGYLPQNNFEFSDLDKANQEKVLSVKPYIASRESWLRHHYDEDIVNTFMELESHSSIPFSGIDKKNIVIARFDDKETLINWLDDVTASDVDKEALGTLDGYEFSFSAEELANYYGSLAGNRVAKLMDIILSYIANQEAEAEHEDEDEEEEYEYDPSLYMDLIPAIENTPQLEDALSFAAEAEARESNYEEYIADQEDENGFYLSEYQVTISVDKAKKLLPTLKKGKSDWARNLPDKIKFTYPVRDPKFMDGITFNRELEESLRYSFEDNVKLP